MFRPSRRFWKQDWGAVWIALAICCVAWWTTNRFERLEQQWYDLMVAATPAEAAPDLAVVAINEASLQSLGPWPWSRDIYARLIDTLNVAGVRLVVLTVPMVGAEGEQAMAQLQRISGTVTEDPELALHPRLPALLQQAQEALDADAHLATSMAHSGHVLLVATTSWPASRANPKEPDVQWPLAALGGPALGIGHLDWQTDRDMVLRTVTPEFAVQGRRIPSLAVSTLAYLRGAKHETLQIRPGRRELSLGTLNLPLDRHGRLRPILGVQDPSRTQIARYSAQDVLSGKTPPKVLAGKVVLIGATASSLAPRLRLPDETTAAPVDVLAQVTAALLNQQVIAQPAWGELLAWLLFLAVAGYLTLALPRLAAVTAIAMTSLIGTTLLAGSHLAFTSGQVWLPPALPLIGLLVGHAAVLAWQFARHHLSGGPLQESFPVEEAPQDSTSELPRDLSQPAATSSEPPAPNVAQPAPATPSGTLPTHSARWPRLGRFQLDREIGHGAMGRVYLAHELETGKVVVIKTLSLAQEFDGDGLREAQHRFRREAEAAGRLQHPYIVRIYETGEERGLAYIAMEWLHGHNLIQHTQPSTLLPIADVLEIVARVAEALTHAHAQGVVHRDIKPGNVMIDPARRSVTVTDFGIARIIDSRSTRTGMMLGSPLYMSPEQLLGRPVDGRSDLYSLGVMLFQLLTAGLPSRGDSIAELIRSITSEAAPDVRTLRPDLPQSVAEVVALALEKQAELRYRSGSDLAADLRLVAAALVDSSDRDAPFGGQTSASVEDVALAARQPRRDAEISGSFVHNRPG